MNLQHQIYRKKAKRARNHPSPISRSKARFTVTKNNPVRVTKHGPAQVWWQCAACNADLWTNKLNYDIFDKERFNHKFSVCNSKKCINLLILQEL